MPFSGLFTLKELRREIIIVIVLLQLFDDSQEITEGLNGFRLEDSYPVILFIMPHKFEVLLLCCFFLMSILS